MKSGTGVKIPNSWGKWNPRCPRWGSEQECDSLLETRGLYLLDKKRPKQLNSQVQFQMKVLAYNEKKNFKNSRNQQSGHHILAQGSTGKISERSYCNTSSELRISKRQAGDFKTASQERVSTGRRKQICLKQYKLNSQTKNYKTCKKIRCYDRQPINPRNERTYSWGSRKH